MNRLLIIALLILVCRIPLFSQTSPITFGAISRGDLESEPYPQEKGAEAVVLCNFVSVNMMYDDGFQLEIVRHVRIKILKPAGFRFGNVLIHYAKQDKIYELQASTYNLENDTVTETPVKNKQFYKETYSPYSYNTRFAFPQVREGSIIEYTYKQIQKEIRSLIPFNFQQDIPIRHVEFWAIIPDFFTYAIKYNGGDKITEHHTQKHSYFETVSTNLNAYMWTGNQLPPLQREPEMPVSSEYFPGVRFALTAVNFPGQRFFEVAPSYQKLTSDLLQFSDLGAQLDNKLLFSKQVKSIISGKTSKTEQMQAIYDHVKEQVKWNGENLSASYEPIRIAYRDKTGNNADINSILINMLRTAGINADAVLLSTRANGSLNKLAALVDDLDYMICLAEIDGKEFLLDATDKYRPLGMLPLSCLNHEGWVLNESRGRWIKLENNEKNSIKSLYELNLDENGKCTGSVSLSYEGFYALRIRKIIHNKGEIGLRDEIIDSIGENNYLKIYVTNLEKINEPLKVTYTFEANHNLQSNGHMLFFKPLFGSPRNPWIKEQRKYPVDFGFSVYDNTIIVYHLPESMQIGELPKSTRLVLPGTDAAYTYNIASEGKILTVNDEFTMTKTWFETDEYPALREFYTQISKKVNEMVILQSQKL